MRKDYLLHCLLSVFVVTLLVIGPYVYADENSALIQTVQDYRVQIEAQLGLTEPLIKDVPNDAEYGGALADHYERTLIMKDEIDKAIS